MRFRKDKKSQARVFSGFIFNNYSTVPVSCIGPVPVIRGMVVYCDAGVGLSFSFDTGDFISDNMGN